MKTMQEIEKFPYTYTMHNVYGGYPIGYNSLEELVYSVTGKKWVGDRRIDFSKSRIEDIFATERTPKDNLWVKEPEADPKYRWVSYYTFATVREGSQPFLVKNNLGGIITHAELAKVVPKAPEYTYTYQNWQKWADREAKWNKNAERRVKVKGSANKIKTIYALDKTVDIYGDVEYNKVIHKYYRHMRTTAERRVNKGHVEEYGPELVRAKRTSRKGLPTYYDDVTHSLHYTKESWKHHSKRRKQWIAK